MAHGPWTMIDCFTTDAQVGLRLCRRIGDSTSTSPASMLPTPKIFLPTIVLFLQVPRSAADDVPSNRQVCRRALLRCFWC